MGGWNHREIRHLAGNILRNLAVIAVDAAEAIDPQPDIPLPTVWPFTIRTSTGTTTAEARITWHETA